LADFGEFFYELLAAFSRKILQDQSKILFFLIRSFVLNTKEAKNQGLQQFS